MSKLTKFTLATVLFFKKFQNGSCLDLLKFLSFVNQLKISSVERFQTGYCFDLLTVEYFTTQLISFVAEFVDDSTASITRVWLRWPAYPDHAARKSLHFW